MPVHPHSPHPILGVVILAMFVAGFFSAFLTSADFSAVIAEIREALLKAFRETGMSQKEIYMAMGYSKGQWSKVLSGEKALSLARLHRTPYRFYVKVWEHLLVIKARDFTQELRDDARAVRRATLAEPQLKPTERTSAA